MDQEGAIRKLRSADARKIIPGADQQQQFILIHAPRGSITDLQFATDFSQMVTSRFSAMAPDEIDRDLYNAERFTVRLYESLARRWDRLNPIPGLYYGIIIRSPAYPFIVLDGLNNYALDLGTFPFTDDQRFRQTMLWQRQYGFEFRIIF